jgi:hypothetical protein
MYFRVRSSLAQRPATVFSAAKYDFTVIKSAFLRPSVGLLTSVYDCLERVFWSRWSLLYSFVNHSVTTLVTSVDVCTKTPNHPNADIARPDHFRMIVLAGSPATSMGKRGHLGSVLLFDNVPVECDIFENLVRSLLNQHPRDFNAEFLRLMARVDSPLH